MSSPVPLYRYHVAYGLLPSRSMSYHSRSGSVQSVTKFVSRSPIKHFRPIPGTTMTAALSLYGFVYRSGEANISDPRHDQVTLTCRAQIATCIKTAETGVINTGTGRWAGKDICTLADILDSHICSSVNSYVIFSFQLAWELGVSDVFISGGRLFHANGHGTATGKLRVPKRRSQHFWSAAWSGYLAWPADRKLRGV